MTIENVYIKCDSQQAKEKAASMLGKRIMREQACVERMIFIFCQAKHGGRAILCEDCQELLDYAVIRLQHCKFGENKPVCSECSIHCYHPLMRSRIIEVMRFAGPRMLFRYPKLAILHLLDSYRGQDSLNTM